MRKYRLVSKKGEGTFSEVLKAQNVKRGTYHAIKVSCTDTLRGALTRTHTHTHTMTAYAHHQTPL